MEKEVKQEVKREKGIEQVKNVDLLFSDKIKNIKFVRKVSKKHQKIIDYFEVYDKEGKLLLTYWPMLSPHIITKNIEKKLLDPKLKESMEEIKKGIIEKKYATLYQTSNMQIIIPNLSDKPQALHYLEIITEQERYLSKFLKKPKNSFLLPYFSGIAVLSLTQGEVVGKKLINEEEVNKNLKKAINENKDLEKELAINLWYATSLYPLNISVSSDKYHSFGAFQMKKQTYDYIITELVPYYGLFIIQKGEKKPVLPRKFEECLSFACQSMAALIFSYHSLMEFEKEFNKYISKDLRKRFYEMWNRASEKEKEKFFIIVLSGVYNLGVSGFFSVFKDFLNEKLNNPLMPKPYMQLSLEKINDDLISYLDEKKQLYKTGSYARVNYYVYEGIKNYLYPKLLGEKMEKRKKVH